jgi:hypothetical protein
VPRRTQIRDPVLRVQHDKHARQSLFVLSNADEWLCRPDTGAEVCGPKLVLVQEIGRETKAYCYTIGDKRPWRWLATLAKAGAWALNTKAVAPHLPPDLLAASPRFCETTDEQREAMRNRPAPTTARPRKPVRPK